MNSQTQIFLFYNIDSFLIYSENADFIQQISCWLVLKVIQTHFHINLFLFYVRRINCMLTWQETLQEYHSLALHAVIKEK